jgi:hypothetical protein
MVGRVAVDFDPGGFRGDFQHDHQAAGILPRTTSQPFSRSRFSLELNQMGQKRKEGTRRQARIMAAIHGLDSDSHSRILVLAGGTIKEQKPPDCNLSWMFQ